MQDTSDFQDGLNMANYICAACYLGIELIWMIIATCCYCKNRDSLCQKMHAIIYSSFFMAFATANLIMLSITFSQLNQRNLSLNDWSGYAECVDTYMQVTDYQVDQIGRAHTAAVVNIVLSCLIFLIHYIGLHHNTKIGCRSKHCCGGCQCCPCCR